jgi:uncharacterized protein YkwD
MTSTGAPKAARALIAAVAGGVLLAGCGTGGASLQGAAATIPVTTGAPAPTGASTAPAAAKEHAKPATTAKRSAKHRSHRRTHHGPRPTTRATPTRRPVPTTTSKPAPTSTSKPAPTTTTPTTPASGGLTSDEAQVLALVNKERASAGCGALTVNPILVAVARAHSKDMAVRGYFDHNSPDGKSPFDRMRDAGYKGGLMGENIAAGQPTPAAVMDAWMKSPGHRANILNCGYKVIGIGVYSLASSPYRIYWTQDFGDR